MSTLEAQRYKRVETLEKRLDYRFSDRALAMRALQHSSYGDGLKAGANNERLEFLGDRVLGLMTAKALFDYSSEPEGTLARRLNAPLTLAQVWRYPDLCIYMYNIWVYTHKCT